MADERIGVLLVHGIGSQKPNEHLIGEAHKIVAAMGEQVASITVRAEPAVAKEIPDTFVADYEANIVRVDVTTKAPQNQLGREICFEFNEVYWADLGEPSTVVRQVNFWFWALSMWSVAGREHSILPGFSKMYIPQGDRYRASYRLMLGFLGALFLLGAGTIGLINMIAERLKLPRIPISGILTDYIGDVMLYSQPLRAADPKVSELGEPPRAEIRARMVDAMVEFALRDYDRWYIVAHSLGTVVAYNGLMETDSALPNYLTEARWKRLKTTNLVKTLDTNVPDLMLPRRPDWLTKTEGIDREKLFAKLGFLTYGSAIGKFHGIWPIMVPCNQDEYVFAENFQWVNVHDWTDPVSGPLLGFTTEFYGPWQDGKQGPKDLPLTRPNAAGEMKSAGKISQNISYKAGMVWLLSHLGYLTYPSAAYLHSKPFLVLHVAEWIRTGTFAPAALASLKRSVKFQGLRKLIASLELALIGLTVWLFTAYLLWQKPIHDYVQVLTHKEWIFDGLAAFLIAFAVNYLIEIVQKISDPSRGFRWATVILSIIAGIGVDWALRLHPGWIVAALMVIAVEFVAHYVLRKFGMRDPSRKVRWAILFGSIVVGIGAASLLRPYRTGVVDWMVGLPRKSLACMQHFLNSRAGGTVGTWTSEHMGTAAHAVRQFFIVHLDAVLFSLSLLSLTTALIVILGGFRWLFQPVPRR